jgi:hypothetical protein
VKSSFHSLIPFLPFLLNHLRLPSQETPSVLYLSCLRTSLYSLGADPTENTVSIVIAKQCFDFCLRIRCRGNLFTESFPSNEHVLWLRFSGFQASCYNIFNGLLYVKRCLWTEGAQAFCWNEGGRQDRGVWKLPLQVDRSHEDAIFWMFSATNTKSYHWIQSPLQAPEVYLRKTRLHIVLSAANRISKQPFPLGFTIYIFVWITFYRGTLLLHVTCLFLVSY